MAAVVAVVPAVDKRQLTLVGSVAPAAVAVVRSTPAVV